MPFQGLDLPGPVLRVAPFAAPQVQEVDADGAGGLAAAGAPAGRLSCAAGI
jgi:hypothetical protein